MKRGVLLSVSDKNGLLRISTAFKEAGYILLATGGTYTEIHKAGIEVTSVEEYTGQKEILDGRVKTLHPKIHAGILARRDDPKHMLQLKEDEIILIDAVIVNLYPFLQKLSSRASEAIAEMIEFIDIGGPTMIRAGAKNYQDVLSVIDPDDYPKIIDTLKKNGDLSGVSEADRLRFASKVFTVTAHYDLSIAEYLSCKAEAEDVSGFSPVYGIVSRKEQSLRYGENPHQRASFYLPLGKEQRGWKQLNGKELSYNNLLDFDATLKILSSFRINEPFSVIVKHLNPCGASIGDTLLDAIRKAKRGDPRSHFGGIIGLNKAVTVETAEDITSDFAEIVLAPGYESDALEILSKNKNLRVISFSNEDFLNRAEIRSAVGGYLVQEADAVQEDALQGEIVSKIKPTDDQIRDLQFAWKVCSHVKSNAIVVVKDRVLIGVGAGQMSRIDSVEVALLKCRTHGHNTAGAVVASDAFFPFPDNIEALGKAGISAVIAPGGAKRDPEVIKTADRYNMGLFFCTDRHFRH